MKTQWSKVLLCQFSRHRCCVNGPPKCYESFVFSLEVDPVEFWRIQSWWQSLLYITVQQPQVWVETLGLSDGVVCPVEISRMIEHEGQWGQNHIQSSGFQQNLKFNSGTKHWIKNHWLLCFWREYYVFPPWVSMSRRTREFLHDVGELVSVV